MKTIAIWMIKLYQLTLGPFVGSVCRFTPTCSDYAIDAIRKYGVVRGSMRAFCRILRCGPWHPGGHDEA